jgi:F0F1-type ATP synthase membrane subunit b/b'
VTDAFYDALATWSQVVGSIAFIIVLVWLFIRFVAPAVAASQERRNAELAEAERRRDAAGESVEAARREVEAASAEAAGILQRVEGDVVRERELILREAQDDGERVVRNAEGELGRARMAARDRLRAELVAQALRIAREAAAGVGSADNDRIVAGIVSQIERDGDRA